MAREKPVEPFTEKKKTAKQKAVDFGLMAKAMVTPKPKAKKKSQK
jgi:hypothetical protein